MVIPLVCGTPDENRAAGAYQSVALLAFVNVEADVLRFRFLPISPTK